MSKTNEIMSLIALALLLMEIAFAIGWAAVQEWKDWQYRKFLKSDEYNNRLHVELTPKR